MVDVVWNYLCLRDWNAVVRTSRNGIGGSRLQSGRVVLAKYAMYMRSIRAKCGIQHMRLELSSGTSYMQALCDFPRKLSQRQCDVAEMLWDQEGTQSWMARAALTYTHTTIPRAVFVERVPPVLRVRRLFCNKEPFNVKEHCEWLIRENPRDVWHLLRNSCDIVLAMQRRKRKRAD
jgi:hypothetical protein